MEILKKKLNNYKTFKKIVINNQYIQVEKNKIKNKNLIVFLTKN